MIRRAKLFPLLLALNAAACTHAAGPPPGATAMPRSAKLLLRYRPDPRSLFRLEVHDRQVVRFNDQELPRTLEDIRLWVTETSDTARGAMAVVASIDSSHRLSAIQGVPPVRTGRGPDLSWMVDTLRRLLPVSTGSSLLASLIPPLTIGTIRFPDDSVAVGAGWTTPIAMRVGHFLEAVSTVRGEADARIEGIWVSGPDTIVRIHLRLPFRGDEVPAPDPTQPQRLTGVFEGFEDFSLSRGVTLNIDLQALAQLEINQRTPLGTLVPPMDLSFEVSRKLLVNQ